ncbi:MAG TPA: FtsX-like permease family protein [Intrasporangium sp.]|uniref:FtsX-like permease family protein n=1 Tax=Intrasporangium sp. TaxID=1925024 RepID=UPI002B462D64|nr:FtsX-like permease family protein [Intrasporangium sp.]HKX68767.1 FtsX-like permease family protein [Intrasporangium sp.]
MTTTLALWWRMRSLAAGQDRVPGLLSVIAFAVATGALLVSLGGLRAFETRNAEDVSGPDALWPTIGETYVTLAWVAVTCLVIPILTLGSVAARLAIARRDQRLAALRLSGATSAQVTVMTLAEAATQAVVGAVAGVVIYAAALPLVAQLSFQGRSFEVSELVLPIVLVALVVLAVVAVALISGLSSLAKVVIGPLGVAARTTPRRLSAVRVAVAVIVGVVWFVAVNSMDRPARATTVIVLSAMILAVNGLGPWVVMVAGRVAARFAPTSATLLAARRIVDDPRSTWRAVGALGLGVIVTGFTTLATSEASQQRAADATMARDMSTGAMVTLAIITVIAATSTGVVQAARVLDQRAQYRALSLAGTPLSTLHRARSHEIGLPLAVTVVVSAGFVLVLMLPFLNYVDVTLIIRFLAAAGVAAATMLVSVAASRGLVRRAAGGTP